MTPELITFSRAVGHAQDGRTYEIVTADRFPDYIAVSDELFERTDRQTIWVDETGFLNIRVANGWATYLQTCYRPTARWSEHVRGASHLEPES